jgi:hypothetical protein
MPATYEPIATTTLGSAASSITFSSISAAYTDLRLVLVSTSNSGNLNTRARFNSDTGTNYSYTQLYADGTGAYSGRSSNVAYAPLDEDATSTTPPVMLTVDFFNYAGSTNKTYLQTMQMDKNGSGSVVRQVGLWRNTAAINTILIYTSTSNFAVGTTATLYGILRA